MQDKKKIRINCALRIYFNIFKNEILGFNYIPVQTVIFVSIIRNMINICSSLGPE